jgi:hypothetical protein
VVAAFLDLQKRPAASGLKPEFQGAPARAFRSSQELQHLLAALRGQLQHRPGKRLETTAPGDAAARGHHRAGLAGGPPQGLTRLAVGLAGDGTGVDDGAVGG